MKSINHWKKKKKEKEEGRDFRGKKGDVTTDSMGIKNSLNNSRLFENLEF